MKNLAKLSFFYTSSSVIVKIFTLLGTIWLIKSFTPSEYAYFAILFSIFQAVTIFGGAGIKESIVGFYKDLKSEKEKVELFNHALVSSFPSIFISILSMGLFFIFIKKPSNNILFFCVIMSLLSGLIFSLTTLKSHMYRLKENHFLSIIYLFFPQIMLYVGGFIFVALTNNPQYFFIGSTISILITTILLLMIFFKDRFKFIFGSFTKRIFTKSIPFFIVGITNWLKGYGNNFIIIFLLDSFHVAAYSFLFTLSSGLNIIIDAVNTVWVPKFYNLFYQQAPKKVESLNNYIFGSLSLLIGIIVAIMLTVYPFILSFFGGNLENYLGLNLELLIILSVVVLYPVVWHLRIHFIIRSLGRRLMNINVFSSALNILIMILAIKFIGNIGIYIGFILNALFNIVIMFFFTPKNWGIKLNWQATSAGLIIPILTHYFFIIEQNLLYSLLTIISSLVFFIVYIFINKNKVSGL